MATNGDLSNGSYEQFVLTQDDAVRMVAGMQISHSPTNSGHSAMLFDPRKSTKTFKDYKKLPLEVKNMILGKLLCASTGLVNPWMASDSNKCGRRLYVYKCHEDMNLNILVASKETRAEGLLILWSMNVLTISREVMGVSWVNSYKCFYTTPISRIARFLEEKVTMFNPDGSKQLVTRASLLRHVSIIDSDNLFIGRNWCDKMEVFLNFKTVKFEKNVLWKLADLDSNLLTVSSKADEQLHAILKLIVRNDSKEGIENMEYTNSLSELLQWSMLETPAHAIPKTHRVLKKPKLLAIDNLKLRGYTLAKEDELLRFPNEATIDQALEKWFNSSNIICQTVNYVGKPSRYEWQDRLSRKPRFLGVDVASQD